MSSKQHEDDLVTLPRGPRLGRRDLFKALGAGAATTLAACSRQPVQYALPYLIQPEEITPGVPVRYASTCAACPAACGLMITARDGRPVKLEGDARHGRSGGGLCAQGQADLRGLYDGRRQQKPLIAGKASTWSELDAAVAKGVAAAKASNKRIVVLSRTITSPTGRAAVDRFLAGVGGTLVQYDPGASSVRSAYARLDGAATTPDLMLDKVDVLVGFDADLLGAGSDPVVHTHRYTERRRQAQDHGPMLHVHFEGAMTLTGAAADERLSASPSERRLMALTLLKSVAGSVSHPEASAVSARLAKLPAAPHAERLTKLATQLVKKGRSALVVSGSQDETEQLAVALTNRLLGAEGRTLLLDRPSFVSQSDDAGLAALLADMKAGNVGALFILGSNPVLQLPGGATFGENLSVVGLSVAVTDRPDDTAVKCSVVAAAHHGLERWGDFAADGGSRTLAQPGIRPLFETRDPFESFLVWAGTPVKSYREHLAQAWKNEVFGLQDNLRFNEAWAEAVRTGTGPTRKAPSTAHPRGSAIAALEGALTAAGSLAPSEQTELELVADVGNRDGSKVFIPWLRELPDALTRVSWTPVVRVSKPMAAELGVKDGDVVTVTGGDQTVTLPARVMPGQHARTVGVPVGYGGADDPQPRPGANGFVLATAEVTVAKTGAHEELPLMQEGWSAHHRPIVFQVSSPNTKVHGAHVPDVPSLWPDRPAKSPQWEMAIDLDACTGCSSCVIACQAENNIAVVGPDEMRLHRDMHWLRIDRYVTDTEENPDVLFEPMLCQHCDDSPCETVCPVEATVHSSDGLNQQIYNRCYGTRYCANNCPYKVRRFNWFDNDMGGPIEKMVLNPDVVVRERGVMEKCSFCVQRIQLGRIENKRDGRADEVPNVQTACQQSCPASAITFGDATNPNSAVSHLKKSGRAFQVLAELGTRPAVTYLARVRNREGSDTEGSGHHG